MNDTINNSIVAKDSAKIKNAKINKIHSTKTVMVSGVIGFILGIGSSILASIIYDNFLKF